MKPSHLILLLTLTALACRLAPPTSAPIPPTPPHASPATDSPSPTLAPPLPATSVPTALEREAATRFPDPGGYEWAVIVQGLEHPIDLQHARDGSGRLFIAEQGGRILVVQNEQLQFEPFLDIRDRVDDSESEQGLLGLAFHPDFASNGFFYVNYTRHGGDTVIARFTAAGNAADPNSEIKLLEVSQPYPNHNGGGLAFGPDGYLYIGLGDGGAGGDPHGNGQKLSTLLGKLLRIDVNNGERYSIPADNPFGNEIWAYGLRNPWRFSFDSLTGDLWLGDVGQGDYEEMNFVPADSPGGINFGWSLMEGMHPFEGNRPPEDHWMPFFEYDHAATVSGCSVVSGYVYRGRMPEWYGIHLFGDYCTGNIWATLHTVGGADESFNTEYLFQLDALISAFGVDENGALYIVNHNGSILRLQPK
ncbi:MAG: Aldose sugar dehydrogenase YliI [Anaerolineales bacterium]|nr:Aldose sugar dehydrogenase YliI [Anaerolineales bacterium]